MWEGEKATERRDRRGLAEQKNRTVVLRSDSGGLRSDSGGLLPFNSLELHIYS